MAQMANQEIFQSNRIESSMEKQWRGAFMDFLCNFKETNKEGEESEMSQVPKYLSQAQNMMMSQVSRTLFVDISDLYSYTAVFENESVAESANNAAISGADLASFMISNYSELLSDLELLVDRFCRENAPSEWREDKRADKFFLAFYNGRLIESIRTLRCEKLGQLISLRGTVTRTSDIRPELRKASFECEICGAFVDGIDQEFIFTQPTICPTKGCGNRNAWNLQLSSCEFSDWQKVRIQEHANEIPAGSMPRSLDIIVRNEAVDRCKAGDKVILTGTLIVAPDIPSLMRPGDIPTAINRDRNRRLNSEYSGGNDGVTGLKCLGTRDLSYRLCFLASHIDATNTVLVDETRFVENQLEATQKNLNISPSLMNKFEEIACSTNCLSILCRNIAPNVFGYSELKKGVLLQLVGGVEKHTAENIKLRGDINICIVGDPSTAKSQILQFVKNFATRAVYATGKSSTAAGLTASVHRDVDQGDFVVEAGALMLADKGICCIDEFDKMEDRDVVAIHEAMEQQTISIAKAGIQATLNARASVLAACSPIYGRYDQSKTFAQNVRISAPILSRFDLFFVMVDDPDEVNDEVLASFMVKLHSESTKNVKGEYNRSVSGEITKSELLKYILLAKTFKPRISLAAKDIIVRTYKALRLNDAGSGGRAMRITVRQLESLIRLSEAIARVKFSNEVTTEHVEEACNIFKSSLSKVRHAEIELNDDYDVVNDKKKSTENDKVDPQATGESENNNLSSMGYADYFKVSRRLVDRVLELEENGSNSIEVADLIAWYITEFDNPESETDLGVLEAKYQRAVLRMIHRDMVLYITEREEIVPEAENGSEEKVDPIIRTFVRVHPNYQSERGVGGSQHATYGFRTFDNSVEQNVDSPKSYKSKNSRIKVRISRGESLAGGNVDLQLDEVLGPDDFVDDNLAMDENEVMSSAMIGYFETNMSEANSQ